MRCWLQAFSLVCLVLLPSLGFAQNCTVRGRVFDEYNRSLDSVKVEQKKLGLKVFTDSLGKYELELPPGKHLIDFSYPSFKATRKEVTLAAGEIKRLPTKMQASYEIGDVRITDEKDPTDIDDPDRAFRQLIPINPKKITEITSVKSDLSSKLATIGAGVVQNSELSSQYRVRGGNFDENLIYVNDIEIYRPFLIRTGQQEGLGFVNPNLATEVGFSSGGFQARFGDKMSSVLDVIYGEPTDLHGSVELGVLNQNLHLEGSFEQKEKERSVEDVEAGLNYRARKFGYLVGFRRFTPSYVLGSLDTQGEYQPRFNDVQGMLTFRPRQKIKKYKVKERKDGSLDTIYYNRDRLKLSFFFNYAKNDYLFTPQSRQTSFGNIQNAFRLQVAFVGQDLSQYSTGLGAFTLEHRPTARLKIKYIVTGFRTVEAELFDVEGGYFLSDVNINFGSEGFNETTFDRGIGTFYRHGRNYLEGNVFAAEQRGDWFPGKDFRHKISWGIRAQAQLIDDQLKEWNGFDSSGYFTLDESFRTETKLNSFVYKLYLQDHWKLSKDKSKRLILGARAIYNDLNGQFLVAPRVQFVIDPASKAKIEDKDRLDQTDYTRSDKRNYQIRFAAGIYHQPLFYREMRDFDGTVYSDRPAQTSYHLIAGGDYLFKMWGRPFKLMVEGYGKYMTNLVPYQVDNVRIRYYPQNTATGYAYGLDTRVTGQFIRGLDSWLNVGLLKTAENVEELPDQGYVSRPTDQRVNFSMYFQDELPFNPTYKVHINFVYGSGLRFGLPGSLENRTVFKVPSYQRVDLGFSKMILFKGIEEMDGFGLQSLWISAEIFNLFQRANTISYTWIKDVFNTQFAIPNFLSARLLNLRVIAKF